MTNTSLLAELLGSNADKNKQHTWQKARDSFWEYCRLINPKFYKEDRGYLKELCNTLQALFEGRIIKTDENAGWYIVDKYMPVPEEAVVCKKMQLNIPPRHGKSYTLTLFSQWLFGRNNDAKIITVSYNETLAARFSAGVRDGINATKIDEQVAIFNDVFPYTHIKAGDSAKQLWSLEGKYFSYLGTGFGGTITGIGCSVGIIDDPVKNAEEAFNENVLEKQWQWYTDTFLSRIEEGGIQIINMTRWATKDLCGRILETDSASDWYVLRQPACLDEEHGIMLCDELLSFESYMEKKKLTSPEIFLANFKQEPIDMIGRLYDGFKTYQALPNSFEEIMAYVDTADTGSDFLCAFVFGVYQRQAYILDVVYTQEPMEITEKLVKAALEDNKVNRCRIEANSGGRAFARNVQAMLSTNYCSISTFSQTRNKQSRILTQSAWIQRNVYFPVNWRDRWGKLSDDLLKYLRNGKNKHDDAADALTGVAETVQLIWR